MKFSLSFELGNTTTEPRHIPHTDHSWNRLRQIIKRRDNSVCHYCGTEAPDGDVDHLVPLSRGGTDKPANLVWSHSYCNRSKGALTPNEWQAELGPAPRKNRRHKGEWRGIFHEAWYFLFGEPVKEWPDPSDTLDMDFDIDDILDMDGKDTAPRHTKQEMLEHEQEKLGKDNAWIDDETGDIVVCL